MRFIEAFVALFVVVNVIPILPVALGMVSELPPRARRRTLLGALSVGNAAGLGFALIGAPLLAAMACTVDDLRIAGGLILFVFATHDLLFSRAQRKQPLSERGDSSPTAVTPSEGAPGDLVPLGIPLLVGPASLTAMLLATELYGFRITFIAVLSNALVNAALLLGGQRLTGWIGEGTTRAIGKLMGLFLAALAVSMVRTGVTNAALPVSP